MNTLTFEQTSSTLDEGCHFETLTPTGSSYLAKQVLEIVGKSGLEELLHFGYEFQRGSELARSIKSSGILSLENTKILAQIMPDTLIALKAYQATFGSAISEEQSVFGNLSAANLINLASKLATFSHSELFSKVEGTSTVMPPIWSVFSESKIAALALGQHNAYHHRLALQPNGKEILAELERSGSTDFINKMVQIMGIFITDNFRTLGKEPLKLLRHFGQQLAYRRFMPAETLSFKTQSLTSLTSTSGEVFSLDPKLSYKLGEIIHRSWTDARAIISAPNASSLTEVKTGLSGADKFDRLSTEIQNCDLLNGFCLAIDFIGKMSASNFEKFLEASPNGNPLNFKLNMQRKETSSGNSSVEFHGGKESLIINTRSESEVKNGFVYQKDYDSWSLTVKELDKELKVIEELAFKRAFKYSDTLSCLPNDSDFTKITAALRELPALRKDLLDLTYKLGMHLFPDKAKELMHLSGDKLIKKLIEALPNPWNKILAKKREEFNNQLSKLHALTRLEITPQHQTLTVSKDSLHKYFNSLRGLIEQGQRAYQSSEYKNKGGVLFDLYTEEFFKTFVAAGNHLLLDIPTDDKSTLKLNGFFMYYIPGRIPASHKLIPEFIQNDPKVSYPQLVMTDENRPSGTNARLWRGHALRLQEFGVDFSSGTRALNNQRQGSALTRFGVLALNLARIKVTTNNGEGVLFEPDLIPINPEFVNSYRENLEKEK